MKLRKIRIGILGIQGLLYRVFIICCNTAFFFTGIKVIPMFGETTFFEALKYALGASLAWNIINTFLYYLFHYIWARLFKLGK